MLAVIVPVPNSLTDVPVNVPLLTVPTADPPAGMVDAIKVVPLTVPANAAPTKYSPLSPNMVPSILPFGATEAVK